MTSAAFKHYFKCFHGQDPHKIREFCQTLSTQTGDEVICSCGCRWEVGFDHSICKIISKVPARPAPTSLPTVGTYRDG